MEWLVSSMYLSAGLVPYHPIPSLPFCFFPQPPQSEFGRRVLPPFQNRVRPGTDAHERQGWRVRVLKRGKYPAALHKLSAQEHPPKHKASQFNKYVTISKVKVTTRRYRLKWSRSTISQSTRLSRHTD